VSVAAAAQVPREAASPRPARARRVWILAAYAVVSFLSFPHPVAGRVLDLGWLLVWLGPALLVAGLRGLAPGRAARAGFLAALVAHAAILHWIYVVTVVYGRAPLAVGLLAPVGLAAYMALFGGAFGAVLARLERRGLDSPPAVAALWAALDHGRHWVLSGFPWGVVGYAQHQNPWLLGLAPWTGVIGLSWVSALGGAALADLVRALRGGGGRPRAALGWLGAVALAHGLGALSLALAPNAPAGTEDTVRIAVLQGDIDQGVKWSPAFAERTLEIYEDLTRRAVAAGARLVLWPETAVPGAIEIDPALRERLEALARASRATLVVGGVGLEGQDRDFRFFDSAFVFDPEGHLLDRYDKTHLVPFGEYVPFRGVLGLFVSALARGIARDDVTPGAAPRALRIPVPDGPPGGVSAGVPICYELLFPDLMRRFVRDGAGVLLAITNDAWYGRTGAPYQFLAITALRSAELRVWTARAANTGVSAFIDERGRVVEHTPIFEPGFLVHDVPLRPPPLGGSFYARHGDVFAGVCWAQLVAWIVVARRRAAREEA